MEKSLNDNSSKKFEKIDLLYLGGNKLNPGGYYDTYKDYEKDYKTILNWLKKFSLENKNLNIVYKDHSNKKINDNYERDFLLNSNIKFANKNLNSYQMSLKSKFICSWASTMIVELSAYKKYCFYLDPGGRNEQFLSGIKNNKLISIRSYNELKNVYKEASRYKFINNDKKKIFSKKSNSTSKNIYKIIKEYE